MKSVSPSRTLAASVLVLAILCTVLVGVLIWRAFSYEKPDASPKDNPQDLKYRFPGYFRTPEEQEDFERIQNVVSVRREPVQNVSTSNYACYQRCDGGPKQNNGTNFARRRRKRMSDSTCALDELERQGVQLTHHVCCVSYASYDDEEYLPSASNPQQQFEIVQGIGNLYQYFETEYCCQVEGCAACQCEQTHYIVSAVVRNPQARDNFFTAWVRVPGCCKCIT